MGCFALTDGQGSPLLNLMLVFNNCSLFSANHIRVHLFQWGLVTRDRCYMKTITIINIIIQRLTSLSVEFGLEK